MREYTHQIAKVAIGLGIISLILSVATHYAGEMLSVGYRGWIAASGVMFLMAIALNTSKEN